MKHKSSRDLYAYWDARRGKRAAPERADIEPGAIRHVLGDSFILALDERAGHPFRLAGTRVCALFGRELKDERFDNLWSEESQKAMSGILGALADEAAGIVAGVRAQNAAGAPLELELILLPLGARRPSLARAIGVLAPMQIADWLGMSPLGPLTLGTRRHIGPAAQTLAAPRFMAVQGRSRHGFVVHDGGRG
jgi:hypothetical protein